jgi:bifunctional UDP-N-acetylglucosamine pyrophosphorylase/glucosamine-1-phosphate N-acetyltransferase
VTVGANCVLVNATVAAGATIKPFCHLEDAVVGEKSQIGPYARLRPGTELGEDVHIGNFVEVKNSKVAAHSKANHLAYVGDADGRLAREHRRRHHHLQLRWRQQVPHRDRRRRLHRQRQPAGGAGAVGKGATLGAGTTLTKDAPAGKLTISRPKQLTIENWTRPVKKK